MALEVPDGLTLYFARHGQTEANLKRQFSGVKDTPLTDLGRDQARDEGLILLRALGKAPALDFVCSQLARAKATMRSPATRSACPRKATAPIRA